MKVHFVGPLEGNKKDYELIIATLEKLGHEMVTKHSIERDLSDVEKEVPGEAELYAQKMKNWIKKADVVVVETTQPLLGAGYEIAFALNLSKPVIVLYRAAPGNTPHVLKGMENEKLQVLSYTDKTLEETLKLALESVQGLVDARFNFIAPSFILEYLDWIARHKNLPRSVYLRNLIEQDMKKNKEFKG